MSDAHESQIDKLIRMANQIAAGFDGYPEADAIRDTAEHIRAFWTPKMRREFVAYAMGDGARLVSRAREAAAKLQ